MDELIKDISEPNFLQTTLGFSEGAQIDLTKLVIGGHSFGGLTALQIAEKDERVQAVFTFDPWIWSRNHDIITNNFKLNVPTVHIVTEGFDPVVEKFFNYNTKTSLEYLLKHASSKTHELIMLKEVNHYHQTDAVIVVPLECAIKSSNKLHLNLADLYLLNTQVAMLFLDKTGLNTSFNAVKLRAHVDKF